MIVLGIETSCDETGVALCSDLKVLSSYTKTQTIHQKYGGVVPEIASREHEKYLPGITRKVIKDANISIEDTSTVTKTYLIPDQDIRVNVYSIIKATCFPLNVF